MFDRKSLARRQRCVFVISCTVNLFGLISIEKSMHDGADQARYTYQPLTLNFSHRFLHHAKGLHMITN